MNTTRDITFDIMKGIGILLVIIGHLAHGYGLLIPIIYTFHMPLFFIVSGHFYKQKNPVELLVRDLKLLIVPYLLVSLLLMMYGLMISIIQHEPGKFYYWLNALLYADTPYGDNGPLWFLLAMFWCRQIYNLLNVYIKVKFCLIIIVTLLFVVVIKFMPLNYNYCCFIVGISCMFYYMIGHLINRLRIRINYFFIGLIMIIGCICVYLSLGVDMKSLSFNCIPVNVLAAISVTYLIYIISSKLKENFTIGFRLAWLGRMSLVVFCIHTLCFRVVPFDQLILVVVPQVSNWVLHGSVLLLHIIISILFCKWAERNKILRNVFSLS